MYYKYTLIKFNSYQILINLTGCQNAMVTTGHQTTISQQGLHVPFRELNSDKPLSFPSQHPFTVYAWLIHE